MTIFTEKVIKIIKEIPRGKVMTYGQIAREADNPRAARQVSRILHSMSDKYDLPWHRVISSSGRVSIKASYLKELQKELLIEEGIIIDENDSIDLGIFQK